MQFFSHQSKFLKTKITLVFYWIFVNGASLLAHGKKNSKSSLSLPKPWTWWILATSVAASYNLPAIYVTRILPRWPYFTSSKQMGLSVSGPAHAAWSHAKLQRDLLIPPMAAKCLLYPLESCSTFPSHHLSYLEITYFLIGLFITYLPCLSDLHKDNNWSVLLALIFHA